MNSEPVTNSFTSKASSLTWEQVPVSEIPNHFIWAWFKPTEIPNGLIIRVPDEAFQNPTLHARLTMRRLIISVGLTPTSVTMWSIQGATYDSAEGTTPLLDQALPVPRPNVDSNIIVWVKAPMETTSPTRGVETPNPLPVTLPTTNDSSSLEQIFLVIEGDWRAILKIEKQLKMQRTKLMALQGRLNSLNRNLTPDEGLHATRQDKSDWQTARRWLRDVTKRVSQSIKTFDIGENSSAGQRNRFEQTYRELITPRKPFEGIQQTQRDFETYRKMIQTLQATMHNAVQIAVKDGERRAQQILSKIANSVRAANTNRG
jgi:hypothetical protein